MTGTIVNAAGLLFLFSGVVGAAGLFVAYQAYRGYQRNESRPMLYLALGIVFLTTVPAIFNVGLSS